jgi:hypothetical protein
VIEELDIDPALENVGLSRLPASGTGSGITDARSDVEGADEDDAVKVPTALGASTEELEAFDIDALLPPDDDV